MYGSLDSVFFAGVVRCAVITTSCSNAVEYGAVFN